MGKWYRLAAGLVVLAVLVVGVRACRLAENAERDLLSNPQSPPAQPGLTLRDVTLEQPDESGQLLWRVRGKEVTYSPDQQVAFVTEPDGELFQDGEEIYNVQADQGEIRENGKVILLRGNIVAKGLKNDSILRGNELEWRPEEDILIVRNQITGSHPKIRAAAQEAYVFNRENRMELRGNVVMNTVVKNPKVDPWLKLQAQHLIWQWDQELVVSPQPLKVEQFEQEKVTDVATGQSGQLNLAAAVVTLAGNVDIRLLEFPLQSNSEQAIWQYEQNLIQVNQPLRIFNAKEQVTVTANQGRMDLQQQVVFLAENVLAQAQRNQAQMTSDQLTWNVPQQTVVAEGNVNYRQVNPEFRLTGPRAVGQLQNQTIQVGGGRVVTEIVPQ